MNNIGWERQAESLRELRVNTVDTETFNNLLSTTIIGVIPLPLSPTPALLDKLVEEPVEAIRAAYSGSARRSYGNSKGKSWWNSSCRTGRKEYKSR